MVHLARQFTRTPELYGTIGIGNMFEEQIAAEPSLLSYVTHLISVWLGSAVISVISSLFFMAIPGPGLLHDTLLPICISAAAAGPAFIASRLVHVTWPDQARQSAYIWIPPVALLLLGLVADANLGVAQLFAELLAPPNDGEAWWAVYLITAPAISCITYAFSCNEDRSEAQ